MASRRVTRTLDRALCLLAVSTLILGAIELALVLPGAHPAWLFVFFVVVYWIYEAAGLWAWWRRPSNRIGALIVISGLTFLIAGLADSSIAVLAAAGTVSATFSLALIVHLLHAFPSGRVHGRASRLTVLGGYVVAVVLQAPLYLFGRVGQAPGLLVVVNRPDLATVGIWVQRGAGIAVVVATTVILGGRLRRTDAMHRRVLGPLFAYGIAVVLFIPISADVVAPLLHITPILLFAMQVSALGGIPVAFSLGVLRGGFARTGELEELAAWLGSATAASPSLSAVLADTVGDKSLQLVFWVADREVFVEAGGTPVDLPSGGSVRASVDIELRASRVGALIYDARLITDPELVRAAGRVVALAVDQAGLTAELLSSQKALLQSRARLVEAADGERRRISQDLHDGLQVELVLLALEAQKLSKDPEASPATREQAVALREGIDSAAGALRQLVYAIMPAGLIDRGLAAATEDLVDRMPVPTRLDLGIHDGPLSASIESVAYFVIAEGLANAIKHAQPQSVEVRLVQEDQRLLIEVCDDGVGGASLAGTTGLRGLADRVDAVGGRLRMDSPPGHGTRLSVEMPCG